MISSEPVKFVEDSPDALLRQAIARYEQESGKPLQPAQIDRLYINQLTNAQSLNASRINHAANQNFVQFAEGAALDNLALFYGVTRLDAQAAQAKMQIDFAEPLSQPIVIPKATQFESQSGVPFLSTEDQNVGAGTSQTILTIEALESGTTGNGFDTGQINILADDIGIPVASVSNTEKTSGGADPEDDAHFRDRVMLAPGIFSVAGAREAYIFHAKSAHQDIIDVSAEGVPTMPPGEVRIVPLMRDGLPSQAILDKVAAACSAETVRPLTDYVHVESPEPIDYEVDIKLILFRGALSEQTQAASLKAVQSLVNTLTSKLGRDIVPEQFVEAAQVKGVYRAIIQQPILTVLESKEWARCTSVNVVVQGVAGDGL